MTTARFSALFDKHGTDKGSRRHRYGELYEEVLRNRSVRSVLEIGVHRGASLLAWAEAWPEALVVGVDVDLRLATEAGLSHPRVHVVQADATDPASAALLPGPFDLIVDDGAHDLQSQSRALEVCRTLLASGGTYVVEDVASEENARVLLKVMLALRLSVLRVMHGPVQSRYDNRLVVGAS